MTKAVNHSFGKTMVNVQAAPRLYLLQHSNTFSYEKF